MLHLGGSISEPKELSFCHKLKFSNPFIFANQCCGPLIFQTLNYVRSTDVSLKYQKCTPSSCKDIVMKKFELEAKTHESYEVLNFCVCLF